MVQGPTYDKEKAEEAYQCILLELKGRPYELFAYPSPMFEDERKERLEKLRQAVYSLFEVDAWENF